MLYSRVLPTVLMFTVFQHGLRQNGASQSSINVLNSFKENTLIIRISRLFSFIAILLYYLSPS